MLFPSKIISSLTGVDASNTRSHINFTDEFLTQEVTYFYHCAIINDCDIDREMSIYCSHFVPETLNKS